MGIKKWFKGHNKWYYQHFVGEEMYVSYPVFRIRPFIAWYDCYIGLFVDRKNRQVFLFLLPMIGLQIGYQAGKKLPV